MTFVSELEPTALWRHFDRILEIPRPSRKEERMRAYVLEVAERCGLSHRSDDRGNVAVSKPARDGRETAPGVVLQSHLDMVTVRNSGVDHDFERDAIQPRKADGWVTATGTSLGADNGIGVAAMLALMGDGEADHGPLELLFTLDEETGLNGASAIGSDLLNGRLLLNLDSEEEGELTVGCAGAAASEVVLALSDEATPPGTSVLDIGLRGLKGGHSGMDIHRHRGNAIVLLARILAEVAERHPLRLARIEGGESHNAIPRESHAVIVVEEAAVPALRTALESGFGTLAAELGATEPELLGWVEAGRSERCWRSDDSLRLLRLLVSLPHGVIRMSPDLAGLVETSTNLARVVPEAGRVRILMSSRSSVDSALAALRGRIRATAGLAGAEVEEDEGYPGWRPDLGSPLLALVQRVHRQVTGKEPGVGAVHAGLECGILGERYPGMDMISFGPTIESPHSPDERVEIGSVERFDHLLREVLAEIARGGL